MTRTQKRRLATLAGLFALAMNLTCADARQTADLSNSRQKEGSALKACIEINDSAQNLVDCSLVIERKGRNANSDLNRALAHAHRGVAHGMMNAHDKALADFDEAIRLNPKMIGAYFNRAILYQFHIPDDPQGRIDYNAKAASDYGVVLQVDSSLKLRG